MIKSSSFLLITILFIFILIFAGCGDVESDTDSRKETVTLLLEEVIHLTGDAYQLTSIDEGLRTIDSSGAAYGIDFRSGRVYKISLDDGSVRFLTTKGRGPLEMDTPSQISIKSSNEFYVYDTSLDLISRFVDDHIVEKFPGWLRNNVWLRHTYGFYWNYHLVTAIEEPEAINSMNFDEARPIAMMNLDDYSVTLHGEMSPTIDKIDSANKNPIIALDAKREHVYYAFSSDYTIMRYCLNSGATEVASSFKHPEMRERSIEINSNQPPNWTTARTYGLDSSTHFFLEVLDDENKLISIWQNATEAFYETRDPAHYEYFGLVYDLHDLSNPRPLEINGMPLSIFNNRLLILDFTEDLEFVIGVYTFDNIE